MKNFKKVIAVLCSATMILGSTMTAFAADSDTVAGDGNIIAFSVETVTLPMSVKVAFNPNGYKVTPREGATPVTDQIVSLNYGIASTANKDRKITVSFTAEGVKADGHAGTNAVVFVDDIKKAQAKSESNADGAEYGEYKMYLAAVAASAAPEKQSGAFAVADFATDAIATTKAALADAKFTAAEKGEVAFADGEAEMAFKLDKATYTQKTTGGDITFATTQADVASKFDLTAFGTTGLVGFTFKGAMNPNVDWTKANITALKIQPEYEIEDADGTEVSLSTNGGLGQIEVAAKSYAMTKNSEGNLTYKFETDKPSGEFTKVLVNGSDKSSKIGGNITYDATSGKFVIKAEMVNSLSLTEGNTTVVATIGGTDYKLTY